MRRWIGVTMFALAGCSRADVALFLPVDDGVRALVVVSEAPNTSPRAEAFDRDGARLQAVLDEAYVGAYEVRITALLYEQPLSALALPAGPLPLSVPPEGGAALPSPAKSFATAVRGEQIAPWVEQDTLPPSIAAIRARTGADDAACLDKGGCFEGPSPDRSSCKIPCPASPEPEPPAPVALPVLTPCAPGFTPRELDPGVVVCDAFPDGRVTSCPRGQAHFVGGAGCEPLGAPCPSDGWPAEAPAGARYVAEGGSGMGTKAAPFGSIAAALAGATPGTVVLVKAGDYVEELTIPDGVRVVGACVAGTTLAKSGGVVHLEGAASLKGFFLERERIVASGAAVDASIEDVLLFESRWVALDIRDGARVAMTNIAVLSPSASGAQFTTGADVTVERAVFDRTVGHGLFLSDAKVELTQVVVDRPRPTSEGNTRTMEVNTDADVTIRRSWFGNGRKRGLFIDRSTVRLEDVTVVGTAVSSLEAADGYGLLIQNDADVTIARSWIHANQSRNLSSLARTIITDSVVSDARPGRRGDSEGFGIYARGASLVLERVAVLDSAFHAIDARASSNRLIDITVRRTGVQAADDRTGFGLYAGGALVLDGAEIQDVAGAAIRIEDPEGDLTIQDTTILRPGRAGCRVCTGICTDGARSVTVRRAAVTDAVGLAIGQVEMFGGALDLQDVSIRHTIPTFCERPVASPSGGLGDGLVSFGALRLRRFAIEDCLNAGLTLGTDRAAENVEVAEGALRGNQTGLNLLFEPSEWRAIGWRVAIADNEVDLVTP